MDYANISKVAASTITALGLPITISRLGTPTTKTVGAFVKSDQSNAGGDPISGISMLTSTIKVMLCPGTIKIKPMVGDDVTCKIGIYHVTAVEEINPAGTVLLYKLTMT